MDIVSRSRWGATAALGPTMRLPAREIWLHHSVTTATGDAAADMRTIERIGVERFGRLSYSWAVHPNGTVLEGAGTTVGAHTSGRNSTGFGIVWIGNYEIHHLTRAQIVATAALIRHLVATGRAVGRPPIGGHRDVKATACPGRHAYAALPQVRSLVTAPHIPELEEPEMKIVNSPGRPALVVSGTTAQPINGAQRAGLLAIGVPEYRVRAAEHDALRSLPRPAAVVDLDEEALAQELAPLLVEQLPSLSDVDLATIAKAVDDEHQRRSTGVDE
jgi:N-acetylmuramoyl-L-alanine amidase